MIFLVVAVFVEVSQLLSALWASSQVTASYYRFGPVVTVETEMELVDSGSSLGYINFTSGFDNVFLSYANDTYLVRTGGMTYAVFPK